MSYKPESYPQTLPVPVTASADGNVSRRDDWVCIKQSSAPAFVAFSVGMATLFPNHPKVILLFIGACVVVIGLHFVISPTDEEQTYPITTAFLQRLPDVYSVLGCILIVLGIGFAFPDEVALIPLLVFVFFSALPPLTSMIVGPRITAIMYGISLASLVVFVVLACTT